MTWNVEYTDEFYEWWDELSEGEQDDITATVELLEERGPQLSYPYSSDIKSSNHGLMRELRVQSDKTGNDRFYEEYVPVADKLYDEHLETLRQEGLIP